MGQGVNACLVLPIVLPAVLYGADPRQEPLRIVLLGDVGSPAEMSRPGVGHADWVKTFLAQAGQGDAEVVEARQENATISEVRKRVRSLLDPPPDILVIAFGRADSASSTPDTFRAEYESLVRDVRDASPETKILLETSPPLGDGHPAAISALPLIDQHALLREAIRSGEKPEALLRSDGVHLTPRGNLFAGRHTAGWILFTAGLRADPPGFDEILRLGAGPIPAPSLGPGPFETIWREKIKPRLIAQLDSPRAEDARRAFAQLSWDESIESLPLATFAALLADPDHGTSSLASQHLQRAATRDGKGAVSVVLALLRKQGIESPAGDRAISFLSTLGQQDAAARTKDPTPSVDIFLSDDDLCFLAAGLASRRHETRSSVRNLLLKMGEAGVDRIFRTLPNLPEDLAAEVIQNAGSKAWKGPLIAYASAEKRPYVRKTAIQVIVQRLDSADILIEFLEEALRADDQTRQNALFHLTRRGREGLDVLVRMIPNEDEELSNFAKRSLFYLGVHTESDDVADKAFEEAGKAYAPTEDGEFVRDLAVSLGLVERAIGKFPPGRFMPSPRAPYTVPQVRAQRLHVLIPRLTALLDAGPDERRDLAETILIGLARRAEVDRKQPPRQPQPLTRALEREAEAALGRGDAKAYAAAMRQAIAAGAGPSTLNDLAWFLATMRDAALRSPEEAEALAREAIARDGPSAKVLDTLGAALAAQGRFDEAVKTQREVLERADAKHSDVASYLLRLQLYLAQKPYTEGKP